MNSMYSILVDHDLPIEIDINEVLLDNYYLIHKVDKSLLKDVTETTLNHVIEECTLPEIFIFILQNFVVTPEQFAEITTKPYFESNPSVMNMIYNFLIDQDDIEKYVLAMFDQYHTNIDLLVRQWGTDINTLLDNTSLSKLVETFSGYKLLVNEYAKEHHFIRYPSVINTILEDSRMTSLLYNEKVSIYNVNYNILHTAKLFKNTVFTRLYTSFNFKNRSVEQYRGEVIEFMTFLKNEYEDQYNILLEDNNEYAWYYEIYSKYNHVHLLTNDQLIIILIEMPKLFEHDFLRERVIELYNSPEYLKILLKNNFNKIYHIKSDNYVCKNIMIDYFFENFKNWRNNDLIFEFYVMRDYYKNPYAQEKLKEYITFESVDDVKSLLNKISLYKLHNIRILLELGLDIEKFINEDSIEEFYIKYVNHYQSSDRD